MFDDHDHCEANASADSPIDLAAALYAAFLFFIHKSCETRPTGEEDRQYLDHLEIILSVEIWREDVSELRTSFFNYQLLLCRRALMSGHFIQSAELTDRFAGSAALPRDDGEMMSLQMQLTLLKVCASEHLLKCTREDDRRRSLENGVFYNRYRICLRGLLIDSEYFARLYRVNVGQLINRSSAAFGRSIGRLHGQKINLLSSLRDEKVNEKSIKKDQLDGKSDDVAQCYQQRRVEYTARLRLIAAMLLAWFEQDQHSLLLLMGCTEIEMLQAKVDVSKPTVVDLMFKNTDRKEQRAAPLASTDDVGLDQVRQVRSYLAEMLAVECLSDDSLSMNQYKQDVMLSQEIGLFSKKETVDQSSHPLLHHFVTDCSDAAVGSSGTSRSKGHAVRHSVGRLHSAKINSFDSRLDLSPNLSSRKDEYKCMSCLLS